MTNWLPNSGLVYPAWLNPGFDQTHPAAGTATYLTAVSNAKSVLYDVRTTQRGTNNGTVTNITIDGSVGPSRYYNGSADRTIFTGRSTALQTSLTVGIIFASHGTGQSNADFIVTSSDANGVHIVNNGSNNMRYYISPSSIAIASSYTVDHTYFIAGSHTFDGSSVYKLTYALKDMTTGKVQTAESIVQSTIAPGGSVGNYHLGNLVGDFAPCKAAIAAAMVSNAFMSRAEMAMWSDDPWGFWYPPNNVDDFIVGRSAAPPTTVNSVISHQWNDSWRKSRTVAY